MENMQNPEAGNGKYDYLITLQSPGFKYINAVSQLLLALFLITYFFYVFRIGFFGQNLWLAAIPLLIIGLWLYGWVRSADKNFQVNYRVELLVAAMAWILLPMFSHHTYIGFGYALMGVIERWVKFPDEIGFSKEEVVRNSIPRKRYEWFEIENVMIRENLFTMDLRNNKIIQKELDEEVSPELEAEFNNFCKEQLHFKG